MRITRKAVIALSLILAGGFLIWWAGISAPKKELVIKKRLGEDIYTTQIIPLYEVYYKWDGKVQEDPWWVILKTSKAGAEWKVVQLKDIHATTDPEEILKHVMRFDSKWVNGYQFSAQPSRYQIILLLLSIQPLFSEEKDIFYNILDEVEEFEKPEK